MVSFFFSPLLGAVLFSGPVATDAIPSLYLIERPDQGTRRLVRLSFNRDKRFVKEILIAKSQRFFVEGIINRNERFVGVHQIVDDRFVTTPNGGVIDIQAKKVIHDPEGEVLGFEAGKLFYKVDHASKEKGIFSFELRTRKLEKLAEPSGWNLPGAKSPDRKKSVTSDLSGVVQIHLLNGTVKDLAKDYHVTYSKIASPFFTGVNCLWLDNERFLTYETNKKLVILTAQGLAETLVEIKDAPETLWPPDLWRDARGRVIYSCGIKDYLIDIKDKTALPLKEFALDHGFQVSDTGDEKGRYSVFHEGKLIGHWIFNPLMVRSSPGLIAFAYVRPAEMPNLGYPDGIAVWSARTGTWQTVDLAGSSLVGWAQ